MKRRDWLLMLPLLAGCLAEVEIDSRKVSTTVPTTTGVYELQGEGEWLRLTGSVKSPSYTATYPNLDAVSKMTVKVKPTGEVEARCETAGRTVECNDPPLFVSIKAMGQGTAQFSVIDVYGELIARFNGGFQGAGASSSANAAGAASTSMAAPTAANAGGMFDGGFGVPRGDEVQARYIAELEVAVQESQCKNAAAISKDYCQRLNGALAQKHITQRFDCTGIVPKLIVEEEVVHPVGPKTVRCRELLNDVPAISVEMLLGANGVSLEELSGENGCNMLGVNLNQSAAMQLGRAGICNVSPLVLDLDGDGVALSSLEAGVTFDLLGNGEPVRTAWTDGKDALLVLDRNGNGRIDGSAELFGNVAGGGKFDDGFSALRELDQDGNNRIDAKDPQFMSLKLWTDTNRDGKSQPSELKPLARARISALDLTATKVTGPSEYDVHGNWVPLVGQFVRPDGSKGRMVDAFFRFRTLSSAPPFATSRR